jgi:ankyrin repeat protein
MRRHKAILSICLSLPLTLLADSNLPPPAKMQVDFNKHVQPILAANCHSCHGAKQQQSGLRLDKRQNALRGGDYGPVIVPGKSAESKLILKLVGGNGGLQMPPTGKLLTEEISILRAWIDQGAEFGDVEIKEEPIKPLDPKLRELITAVRLQLLPAVQKLLQERSDLLKASDNGGSTLLHHAAGFGNLATLKLLLDSGADVNAQNRLGSTPLHWAVADEEKVRLLLERGASVNARTYDGRTPLYLAASQRQSIAVLRLLLERGADPNLAMLNGRTPLMAAAGGDIEGVELLLKKNANPQAASSSGSTALFDAAANRNLDVFRLLLDKGADASHRTKLKQSVLGVAAMYGSEEIVKMLLDRGASVNIQDERGYSPLMYAAYSENMPAGVVRMLLAKGADTSVTGEGETPRSLAAKRGDSEVARLLGVPEAERKSGGVAVEAGSSEKRPITEAVSNALALLERQSPQFVKRGGCNSCHNQSLPSAALAIATDRGIPAPSTLVELPLEMVEKSAERTMDMSVIGVNSVGYEMFGMAASHQPADEYTDSIVHYLKMMQMPQGYWQTALPAGVRPPLTSDDFLTTAMTIYALAVYSPPTEKADTERRLARAAAWLASSKAVTTQEQAFQLLGIGWAKGDPAAIERAMRGLVETQRPDGGWSQLPTMGSDAYATGEALYALSVAGNVQTDNSVYQRGMKYLLRTQAPDGSWHVKSRSLPFQPYFESGFPHGHDQWISAAGTSWASMALSRAVEPQKLSRR